MKLKKIIPLLALTLCTATLGSCATAQKTPFGDYWNENSIVFEQIHETLVYDVTFEKGVGFGYELDYSNGTYTTVLKNSVNKGGDNIYIYTTELSIDVTYTLGEESTTLTDNVKTEVHFFPAKSGLTPIYSKKSIVSSSPMTSKPEKLEQCYLTFAYEIETTYTENGGETKLVSSDKTTTANFEIDEKTYRYLDNEQLLLALRALPASVSSAHFLSYSPFAKNTQKIAVACASTTSGDFEFQKNGSTEKIKESISYRPMQIKLDEKNPGLAQTAWIAATTDSYANKNRNVMLRLETPLYQAMGTLIYQLASVNYQ